MKTKEQLEKELQDTQETLKGSQDIQKDLGKRLQAAEAQVSLLEGELTEANNNQIVWTIEKNLFKELLQDKAVEIVNLQKHWKEAMGWAQALQAENKRLKGEE